jgi:hypothetical protein
MMHQLEAFNKRQCLAGLPRPLLFGLLVITITVATLENLIMLGYEVARLSLGGLNDR